MDFKKSKMRCAKLIVISLFVFIPLNEFCQVSPDKLRNDLDPVKGDVSVFETQKNLIDSLNKLGISHWRNKSYDKAKECFNTAVDLSLIADDRKLHASSLNNLGLVFYSTGDFSEGIDLYKQSLTICRSIGDETNTAKSLLNLGIVYKRHGIYDQSLECLLEAATLFERNGQLSELASAYNSVAGIQLKILDYSGALKYNFKSLEIRKLIGDERGVAGSLNNIGNVYKNCDSLDIALNFYRESLEIKMELGDSQLISSSYLNIGKVYYSLKEYVLSEENYTKALSIKKEIEDKHGMILVYNSLGELYLETGDFEKARLYLLLASYLSKETKSYQLVLENLILLKQLYKSIGDFQKALSYSEESVSLTDSIFNQEKTRALTDIQLKYETQKKEMEITSLQNFNEIQSNLLISRRNTIISLVVGFFLLLVLLCLIYYSYRLKKTANEKIKTLMQERQHRAKNNRQLLSSILNLQSDQKNDAKTMETLKSSENRVQAISLIDKMLFNNGEDITIKMDKYLYDLINYLLLSYGLNELRISLRTYFDKISLNPEIATAIGIIVNELVTNSLKHAFNNISDPELSIELIRKTNNKILLKIADNGIGMPEEINVNSAESLGLKLIKSLISQIKGDLKIENKFGTIFYIEFKE